ncbi:four helix bundle protein [Tianweitania populi]|uniref:Four helix bundle protein n=1 Tax=Tianweitania populi TaxID=1607949 RepID=A0A8J3DNR7_9HYPH|nr:four helix bundle protein [Tianweitania populi]GHD14404.1 four helix bundle protein [Tianweitania populi]
MAAIVQSYKDLLVWQQAMDLAASTYQFTRGWPREELYGLTSQVRRAATSVAANIAEGWGRQSRGAFQQFLKIAQGSLKEVETHLLIAERIGLTSSGSIRPLLDLAESIGKLLHRLITKLTEKAP